MPGDAGPAPPATAGPPPGRISSPLRRALWAVDARHAGAPLAAAGRDLVKGLGVEITLCHAVMRPTSAAGNESDGVPANPEEIEIVRRLRASAIDAFGDAGRDVPVKVLHGDPGQRLCEYADYLGSDLIVLGPRAPGSIAKSLRGSVSRFVLANSRCHVLVLGDEGRPTSRTDGDPPPGAAGTASGG